MRELGQIERARVCAVSFLNTAPLVWGMEHGPQRGVFDVSYAVPSACADAVAAGAADIGLVPVAEIARLGLHIAPGVGIACRGAVRSILLVSKVAVRQIRTLAADTSSRTSVELARVILREKFGVAPEFIRMSPSLASMLGAADAALLIGDAALRLEPAELPFVTLDLGAEWVEMTGRPFVFAAWAGRARHVTPEVGRVFVTSYEYGRAHLDDLVEAEARRRGFDEGLVRRYLTEHIRFELGEPEREGLRLFLDYAGLGGNLKVAESVTS
ncbi:MAG: menaquinone biosynthesis protein [Bryobacteraceae bacterium]|nr:menaquinone biosynthesis protein [Bryobacteraceae bacterium]